MAKFEIAFEKLLKWEGGKVNDPIDPGGKTAYGVTQRAYDAFAKLWNLPAKDVYNLSLDDARAFYITEYWTPMKLTRVHYQPLADALLSFAANQGRKPAVRRLQAILELTTDGIVGEQTIGAINAAPEPTLLRVYLNATSKFYDTLIERRPALAKFETGWKNRVYAYQVTV